MELVMSNDADDLEYQPHDLNDSTVWGLRDVARGRTCSSPTTIYRVSGDSASGVAGRLLPSGEFCPIHSTRIGNVFVAGALHNVKPAAHEPTVTYETAWDGAAPCPVFEAKDEDTGVVEIRQERSKGLLLGSYERKPAEGHKGIGKLAGRMASTFGVTARHTRNIEKAA
jgi:hypothetical protein